MRNGQDCVRNRFRPFPWALFIGSAIIAGCGSNEIANVPVSGRVVTESGIPLDEGRLILVPDPPDDSRQSAGATIGTDGTFTCYSTSGGPGIPPGRYKVLLSFASGKGSINPYVKAFADYTQLSKTPLVLDVPAEGRKDVVFELKEP